MQLSSPEEIIDDIRAGKMVVLMDDEDRENEGDLIMAANCVTPEAINFMTKYGRGLICLTLSEQRCRQLKLPLMVQNNGASYGTNFTVSIEAAQGVTTGISASDRATTVLAAVAPNAQPEDIVQPGHIFPIMAQSGGVLNRAGHTEAGCDLARLAGFEPAGVIVEILNDDGTMARRSDLETFAQTHNLKLGTIADLIEYRSLNERSIEKVADCQWPSRYGEFQLHAYQDTIDGLVHYGLSMGNITHDDPTLVRVHVADTLTDLLGGQREGKLSWQLDHALQRIAKEGHGVVLVVTKKECPRDIIERLTRMEGIDKGNIPARKQHNQAVRTIGIGSQILADIGVGKMRLLSAPKRYNALSGFKLEVIEYIEE